MTSFEVLTLIASGVDDALALRQALVAAPTAASFDFSYTYQAVQLWTILDQLVASKIIAGCDGKYRIL